MWAWFALLFFSLAVGYALLFIGLALFACMVCLIVKPLRKYRLEALVLPLAFGVASIVGGLPVAALADLLSKLGHIDQATRVFAPFMAFLIYVFFGLFGVGLGMKAIGRWRLRRISRISAQTE